MGQGPAYSVEHNLCPKPVFDGCLFWSWLKATVIQQKEEEEEEEED